MKPAQPAWGALGNILTPLDTVSVSLTQEELDMITRYGDQYFNKGETDWRPSQWPTSWGKNRGNSNTKGIIGEWAATKVFSPQLSLQTFLDDRPWKMADHGDVLFKGDQTRIFDYKTRTRKESIEEILGDDTYMAEMDAKFSDRKKYHYLQGFVFSVYNPDTNVVTLIGWMLADEYFAIAQEVKAGNKLPQGGRYFNDVLMVPYRRLRSIDILRTLQCLPINKDVTLQLKAGVTSESFTAHL